jgi:hypothetical protein
MKKVTALLLTLLSITFAASSQKVDSIKTEQSGDFIKIRYKILQSRPGEIYNVKILCSINGGLNTELRSVSGDVGDMVQGGKNEYWIVWDVLKDVEELKSGDFIIRAELTQSLKPPKDKGPIFSIAPAIQFPGPGLGVRLGVFRKFGISLQFISWKAVLNDGAYTADDKFKSFSIALASRLSRTEKSQVHLLTGFTGGNTLIKEPGMSTSTKETSGDFKKVLTPGPELGLAVSSGRMIFIVTGTKLMTGLTEHGESFSKNTFVSASVGVKF